MFDRLERKFEKPSDEIGTVKLIELMSASEEKGRKLMTEVYSKAEAAAKEKAEFMEELRNEFGSKDKSMTDKLIESLLPVIAVAAANKQASPQSPVHDPNSVQTVQPTLNPQTIERMNQERRRQSEIIEYNKKAASQGGPKNPPQKEIHIPKGFGVPQKPKEEVNQPMSKKETIKNLLIPHFGAWLTSRRDEAGVRQSVTESLSLLRRAGLSREEVLKEFTFDDLQAIVKEKMGLTAGIAMPWFKAYYGFLSEGEKPLESNEEVTIDYSKESESSGSDESSTG